VGHAKTRENEIVEESLKSAKEVLTVLQRADKSKEGET